MMIREFLNWFYSKLEDDARQAWKWLSIQFAALAGLCQGLFEGIKQGWVEIPDDLKSSAMNYLGKGVLLFIGLAIIGRLIKQRPSGGSSE